LRARFEDATDKHQVAGCYILEPASYAIWENIKAWFDAKIKVKNLLPS
jgi:prolyl-tRNA synthetase